MRRIPVTASAALAALLVLSGCGGDEAPDVRVADVGRATVAEVVEAPGAVVARATATVDAPASGDVAALEVAEGETVEAGQVLLRIDSPSAREQLRQAEEADRRAAEAGVVDIPASDLSAEQQAADEGAARAFANAHKAATRIPDERAQAQAVAAVAAAHAQYAAARAQARDAVARFDAGLGSLSEALSSLGEAQRIQTGAAVTAARRTVEALVVRAPIAGVVSFGSAAGGSEGGDLAGLGEVPEELAGAAGSLLGGAGGGALGSPGGSAVTGAVSVGSPVSVGQQLLTLTDTSTLSLTAEVDETDVLLVEPGVRAEAELDAVPGATYAAKVTSVDPAPTTSARGGVSYVVRLSLGPGETLDGEPAPTPRPGMSAIVDLLVRTAEDALAVSSAAVFREGQRDAVWVVDRGAAELRTVRVGAQGEELVEVLEGLTEGERVVVAGADQVRAGQQLQ